MVSTPNGGQPTVRGGGQRVISIRVWPVCPIVADQPEQNQNVVIPMTAVRRAARALKRINSEQVLMWEAFWRAGRFPVHDTDGARPGRPA